MTPNRSNTGAAITSAGRSAGWLVLVLGLGHASVSAYWASGGTGMLDTVGGVFERAGRSGGAALAIAMWVLVAVKAIAAVLPLLVVQQVGAAPTRRRLRRLAWVQGWILTGYGLAQTGVGLLVQTGIVPASADADHQGLAWHAYLWDPWFLLWGVLVIVALRRSGTSEFAAARMATAVLTAARSSAGSTCNGTGRNPPTNRMP